MAKKVIEEGKALFKSKTFWFNALFVVASLAGLFGFNEFQPNDRLVEVLAGVAGLVNILLRVKTSEPITRLK